MPTIRPLTAAERTAFEALMGAANAAPPSTPVNGPVVPPSFLNRSVAEIVADLPDQTDTELHALRQTEISGKTRKSMLDAVDAEIARRKV